MAVEHEHQDELPQGSPVDHQEASTSEAISQITNLTRLVEELTKKHNDQQRASAGGWQHATPFHPQRSRATYSPITPMQPLFASEDTPVVNERQAHPRQTAQGTGIRRQSTPNRRSTPDLPQASEDLLHPGTNVEEMM
ncbi:hypothetical protein TIFTF001_042145 [Ficus carica]|uniref:Uncharacterized protein n=1 Tax=Ficus carica TaxID=3494 RepID=A0AA88CU34_FICCA|nr:hypothetical protein TIFTF001_042145 [Ficus carica]